MSSGHGPPSAERLVPAIAAVGLATSWQLPAAPTDAATWSALTALVRRERLEGPLALAVASGSLATTPDQAAEVAHLHEQAMATVLVRERRLVAVAEAFERRRIRWRVLKGSAVAHVDEIDPAVRCYADVDVLVAGPDLAIAYAELAALGGRRHYDAPSEGYDERFGKGAAWTMPDGVEVDVHRTLALGPYGLAVVTEDLFAATAPFEVAGQRLLALDATRRFLHACYHATLGRSRLVSLRDVALLTPRDEHEGRHALALARRWRGEAVVAAAVAEATTRLALRRRDPLTAWALALRPRARDRRWLAAYRGPLASSAMRTLLAAEALPGPAVKVAYARTLSRGRRRPGTAPDGVAPWPTH